MQKNVFKNVGLNLVLKRAAERFNSRAELFTDAIGVLIAKQQLSIDNCECNNSS